MRRLDLDFMALHTGAELRGDNIAVSGVSTDTRTLQPGELFVALSGPHFDGHDFVAAAQEAGAAAVMVSHAVESELPQLVVPDTLKALGQVASAWRCEFSLPVIGITGSSGKTTVKQMLASILGGIGKVLYTEGNFNNDIGLPLTLLRLRDEHEFAVIEMGANHAGEIAYLVSLTRPEIALVNNAGEAHLEGFGSLEGVIQAKGEIYQGVVDGGTCIINGDQPWADEWVEMAGARRIIRFGMTGAFDIHVAGAIEDAEGAQVFSLATPSGAVQVRLPLPGRHNVMNALAAAAAAWCRGANPEQIRQGLETVESVKGRMAIEMLGNDTQLVDDSYNANPLSLRAAIDWLVASDRVGVLVMGDMGELGHDAEALHRDIGEYAAERGVRMLYAMGELSRHACDGFGEDARHFGTAEDLIKDIDGVLKPGMTVLVKGSRSARMERIVEGLRQRRAG
jgi:UDP-N-acetylmuramoyl-tripeptide--D-alanyl-D-alanine ligase